MKARIVKCAECGAEFESTAHNVRFCPECRLTRWRFENIGHPKRLGLDNVRLRRQRAKRKNARDAWLRARDAEYAKLGVPVTTRVAADGSIIEVRGQPHFGSCCGTLHGTDASVARRYM